MLASLNPEQVEVEICRADALDQRRGVTSELDEMWAYVAKKATPRWLWHAIDHYTGKVLAYVFGRRKDDVFLRRQKLLEPFGITKFYTDGWGGSGRQGHNPAGGSPVMSIARFRHVAIPHLGAGNQPSYAWCKRPGRPGDFELQRWAQPGGLASMGA